MIPTFGDPTPDGLLMVMRIWRRRWVRVVALVLIVAVAAGTAWHQLVVKPTLTATRLQVWVQGEDRRLTIGVDGDTSLIVVSGGQSGLSQVIVSNQTVFVLSAEVGVDGAATWVSMRLTDVDRRFGALVPSRVLAALDVGVKRCEPPSEDANVIFELLLDVDVPLASGASLCSKYVGVVAEDGEDVLVEEIAVRPDQLDAVPTASVIDLADVPDPDAVLAVLDQLVQR